MLCCSLEHTFPRVLQLYDIFSLTTNELLIGTFSSRCLKITQKVSFNIASEASYIYISKVNKSSLKLPKNGQFWRVFENSNATFWVIFTHCGYIRKILPRSVKPWGVLIISFFLLPTLWNFFHFFFKFPRVKGTNKCVLGSLCCQTDFFFKWPKGTFTIC